MEYARKHINSHEFKFSMIPFSEYNNTHEVNLYHPSSKIPYLYKDPAPGANAAVQGQPSLFFECYSDDIYEAILEDLRAHYIAISNQDLEEDEEDEVDGDEPHDQQYR